MGMERLELTDDDIARIESLAGQQVIAFVEALSPDQRDAVKAHVIDERGYGDIARELHTTEAVVRKRVSRGLGTLRKKIRSRP